MSLAHLDSRAALGSDIDRRRYDVRTELEEGSSLGGPWIEMRQIRVVLGKLGPVVRLSAPQLDLAADGLDFDEAWATFLQLVADRSDSSWLTFDVGPLRDDEALQALDAPEDELWSHGPDDEA